MPRFFDCRPLVVCVLGAVLTLPLAVPAAANEALVPAKLRVLESSGKVLAEETLRTGTTTVPTSPKATCFGRGTGGDGKSVTVSGATPLGLLAEAAETDASLRPLLVSDHFSFGLALCGVGGAVAKAAGPGFWSLTVNHKSPSQGGSKVKLHPGDEVLWYLTGANSEPEELVLSAPRTAVAAKPFGVRVFIYNEKGIRRPAVGASVSDASAPTDASGRTTVTLGEPAQLRASLGTEIPSSRVAVCVGGRCPGGSSR